MEVIFVITLSLVIICLAYEVLVKMSTTLDKEMLLKQLLKLTFVCFVACVLVAELMGFINEVTNGDLKDDLWVQDLMFMLIIIPQIILAVQSAKNVQKLSKML